MKKFFLTAIVITSLFACKQNTETKSEFDLVNAKKEIESANQNVKELLAKGDSIGFANSYTADAKFMESNQPSIVGKPKIQSFWTKLINAGATNISLTTLEVWGNENYITEEGLYDFKSKDGAALGNGKYIVLWKKEDGKWKLHRDISNTNLPLETK
jgi:ketosteroid isomerase-like protein